MSSTATLPKFSVVTCCYNQGRYLKDCIESVLNQQYPNFEHIVVDDGSTDDTWEWLEQRAAAAARPQLVVRRQENRGQGQARNRGVREVEEELVLFLGDDIIPRPDFVAEHRAAHARRRARPSSARPAAIVGFTDWRRSEMRVTPALAMANV